MKVKTGVKSGDQSRVGCPNPHPGDCIPWK